MQVSFNTRISTDNYQWLENYSKETGISKAKIVDTLFSAYRVKKKETINPNEIQSFINETCVTGDASSYYIKSSLLYDLFLKWGENKNLPATSQKTFSLKLLTLGYKKHKICGCNIWRGLAERKD